MLSYLSGETQPDSLVLSSFFQMNNTSLVLSFHLSVFEIQWAIKTNVTGPRLSSLSIRCRAKHHPLILRRRAMFFYPWRRCCIFPLSASASQLTFPSQCQSVTVEWKMCPIFQGQANNDWKAIEVKQTDSIQLLIAVFASISTCEEVSKKTFFFFFSKAAKVFLASFHSLGWNLWTSQHLVWLAFK